MEKVYAGGSNDGAALVGLTLVKGRAEVERVGSAAATATSDKSTQLELKGIPIDVDHVACLLSYKMRIHYGTASSFFAGSLKKGTAKGSKTIWLECIAWLALNGSNLEVKHRDLSVDISDKFAGKLKAGNQFDTALKQLILEMRETPEHRALVEAKALKRAVKAGRGSTRLGSRL